MSGQAFEIYKLLLAQSRTDWDFRPLAARAFDAAEVSEQEAEERGVSMTQQMNSPGSDPSGVP